MLNILKNMKIGKKIIITFLIVTILSSCSGIVSLFLMSSADTQYSKAIENYGFSQGYIGLLLSAMNENSANLLVMVAENDETDIQNAQVSFTKNSDLITGYMKSIEKSLQNEQDKQFYKTINENMPQFSEHALAVIDLVKQGSKEEALELYQNETTEHLTFIKDAASDMMESYQQNGTELSESLTKSSHYTIIGIMVLVFVCLALSLGLALYLSRSIANPMGACSQRLLALSNGDLKSPVPVINSKDETGVLAQATESLTNKLRDLITEISDILTNISNGNLSVNYTRAYGGDFAPLHTSTTKIIDSLNDAFSQINESADQVAGGADQVSDGAQALSQGATEQASSIEELAATINDISTQIANNADSASSASIKAKSVGNEVTESNQRMQDMLAAIQGITSSSNEISKIIKTIEDIAFQTNILALNAAVEAARAGTAGKGFAVVADEVRSLATKSSEASKNTAILIEQSLSAVDNGTRIVDETAASLSTVVSGVEEVAAAIDAISAASVDQADSAQQVTQGIDQIASVVQTNSATAEESAAASEELSGQAEILKNLINQFQLKNNEQSSQHAIPNQVKPYRPTAIAKENVSVGDKY